jgi:hypothetical protein
MTSRSWTALLAFSLAALLCISLARAENADETAIRDALMKWAEDFKARNSEHICDLFDPALRYDFRGAPERGFETSAACCDAR